MLVPLKYKININETSITWTKNSRFELKPTRIISMEPFKYCLE